MWLSSHAISSSLDLYPFRVTSSSLSYFSLALDLFPRPFIQLSSHLYPPSFLLLSTPASTHSFIISISSFLSLLSLLFPFFPCLFCVHWSSKSSSFPMSQFLFRTWLYQMNQRASFFIKKEKTKGHFTRSDFIHIFVIYPKKRKGQLRNPLGCFQTCPVCSWMKRNLGYSQINGPAIKRKIATLSENISIGLQSQSTDVCSSSSPVNKIEFSP